MVDRALNPLPLQPAPAAGSGPVPKIGKYDFIKLTAQLRNATTGTTPVNCDAAHFVIYRLSGGSYYRVISLDVTSSLPTTTTGDVSISVSIPDESFMLLARSGETYYWGLALHGPSGRGTGKPGIVKHATSGVPTATKYWYNTNAPSSSCFPDVLGSPDSGISGEPAVMYTQFMTATRKVYSAAGIVSGSVMIPRRLDGPYWIVLRSAVAANTEILQSKLAFASSTGGQGVLDTLRSNMNSSPHKIEFNGLGVDVLTGEAGQTIDFGLLLHKNEDGDAKGNVFWVNRSTGRGPGGDAKDIVTISHRTKYEYVNSGTDPRGDGKIGYVLTGSASGAANNVEYLQNSAGGSSTLSQIEVCDQLCVLFGEGNLGKARAGGAPANVDLLGTHVPDDLELPLSWWLAAIPANKLTADTPATGSRITAGYQRFCNSTPGNGDICDMWNVLLVFQQGVDDLVGCTADTRNATVGLLYDRLRGMMEQWFSFVTDGEAEYDRNNRVLLLGPPPYADQQYPPFYPTTGNEETQGMIQWGEAMLGISSVWRVPLYFPFYAVVNKATNLPATNPPNPQLFALIYNDYMERNTATGQMSQNLYSSSGAAAISPLAVLAYQTNRIAGAATSLY